ncbi:MAG: oligoendopeptidase F [Christensenellaceae bacterium]|nr:oligoendopeptidase F [Christensenellaceae bacterium]
MESLVKTRQEIPNEYKWKLEDIYASVTEWEKEFSEAEAMIPHLSEMKDTLISDAESFLQGIRFLYEAQHKLERLYIYARMKRDEDNSNSTSQALTDRAMGLSVRFSAESAYIEPLILSAPEGVIEGYVKEKSGLKEYAFFLENIIRSKKYVLSEKEERLLSLAGDFSDGAHDTFTMLDNADLDFGEIEHNGQTVKLTHGSYMVNMFSEDRELRKKTYFQYYSEFKKHINTITSLYSTSVKKDVFYARARGFESARHQALFGDNVTTDVYDKLIEDVHAGLKAMYRYVSLRKKALKVDELHMYDVYAPIVEDVQVKYPYEKAKELVLAALEPLGEEYISVLKTAFTDGWIDVYETKGKTTGAYSWGVYGTHPYVLLNHTGELNSVFTLAHELGHAMHTYLSNKTQPYATSDYRIFVAEIASTVNEILLTKYLLKTETDKKLRAYLLNHYIDQFKGTVFRQTMFAEFEHKAHTMAEKGEPLTPQSLSDMYEELNKLYFGDEMVSDDDTIRYEWARIPHFYRAFYVYKYATGLSTAVAIAKNLDNPDMLKKYLGFLSAGGSDYPLNIINSAGVTFDTVVKDCMTEFERALSELEALY